MPSIFHNGRTASEVAGDGFIVRHSFSGCENPQTSASATNDESKSSLEVNDGALCLLNASLISLVVYVGS